VRTWCGKLKQNSLLEENEREQQGKRWKGRTHKFYERNGIRKENGKGGERNVHSLASRNIRVENLVIGAGTEHY